MAEEKEVKEYKLVEVPTAYGIAIATPEGEGITTDQALVEILNKLDKIEKAVA
jgi:hypothetical protein